MCCVTHPFHLLCWLLQLDARVLPTPRLQYTSPECMDVGTRGAWNLTNVK